ncbi:MAG: SulP family inorganic anion transporter [Alphaproteobacteria bacterium]|nr:SulP family inorganic anion transporter [Alphaproteobacteria bacterium]
MSTSLTAAKTVGLGPSRLFPFLSWMPLVDRKTLLADLSAGLTGAIVVLPQGVAFATIAGMPPEYGLYAGMIPAIIAALFGSSWHLVSGPTTAASIVLFSSLSLLAEPGSARYVELALTLAVMVGLLELALGLFRLGTLVNFISHSVIIGFTAGAGILIAANQIKNFLDLPIPRGAPFHEIITYVAVHAGEISWAAALTGTVTLVTGIVVRRFWPRVPYMIVAIAAGGAVAAVLGQVLGVSVRTVGALPSSLPPLSAPILDLAVWRELAPTALAVTLFALTEAVSISRALAVRSGQHIDGNQEFIGQGLSNIAGSFFSGYVATGSFNRSGLNYEAGAKTPLAAVFAGAALMAVVVAVAPLAVYMPDAAMAGMLFLVAWGLIDRHHIAQILRASPSEAVVLVATFLATLLIELEQAIFVGVILSLVVYLRRTSHPAILVRVPDPGSSSRKFITDPALPECPQVRFIRIDGSMFFGAVNFLQETLRRYEAEAPERRHLAIVMSGVNFIDVAGVEALIQEAKRFRARGGGLYLVRVKEGVLASLRRSGGIEVIGADNIFQSKTGAIRAIYSRIDPGICRACALDVFVECARRGRQEPPEEETIPMQEAG